MTALRLRTPVKSDWPTILELANAALPWDASGNRVWLENRKRFGGRRRHYLAEDEATGQTVGYGAIEEGPEPDNYRLFVVMDSALLATGPGALLYERLAVDLSELGANGVWMREYASDTLLLAFFAERGFVERERFRLEGYEEMVVMVARLG